MCVESQSGIVATLVNSAFVRMKQKDRHWLLQDSVGFRVRETLSQNIHDPWFSTLDVYWSAGRLGTEVSQCYT